MSKVIQNPLFQGVSRPKSWLGADYNHLILSGVITSVLFLAAKNPLFLLTIAPLHLIGVLLYKKDPYFYNILRTLGETYIKPKLSTGRNWGGALSFSPATTRWKK